MTSRDARMKNARTYVQQNQPQHLIKLFQSERSKFSNSYMNELIEIALQMFHKKCLVICVAKSFSNGFFHCTFDSSKIGIQNIRVNDRIRVILCFRHLLRNLRTFDSNLDETLFIDDEPNLTFDEWCNLLVTDTETLFDWHNDIVNKDYLALAKMSEDEYIKAIANYLNQASEVRLSQSELSDFFK
jgi:hypothetical protein